MKDNCARLCGVAALVTMLLIVAQSVRAQGNSVFIESKMALPGATDVSVGVYISNAVALTAIALPLEFRTVGADNIPHAFTLGPVTIDWNSAGRCYSSVLGPNSPTGIPGQVSTRYYWVRGGIECSGPTSGTYSVAGGLHDDLSPDGNLFTAIATGCDNCGDDIDLDPGMETPGVDAPSLLIQFDVNNVPGRFEIDTCCMRPATHLYFIDRNSSIVPGVEFTKGVITVGQPLENSVVVESKQVIPGQTGVRIGVYISNVDPIAALVIPLELRTLSPTPPYSFREGWNITNSLNAHGRLNSSPLGTAYLVPGSVTTRIYITPVPNTCSGPISNSYQTVTNAYDPISPDGTLLACFSQGDPNSGDEIYLPPGSETPGQGSASYFINLDVNNVIGQFEIDTCCVLPGNHLTYADADGNLIPVSFTKGIISIGCFCHCHGDPDCNGHLDIVDVVRTVNTAFRGSVSITDQDCTHARTDVDANAMTDVLDVTRMIDVVFGGELQDDVFVDPCAN